MEAHNICRRRTSLISSPKIQPSDAAVDTPGLEARILLAKVHDGWLTLTGSRSCSILFARRQIIYLCAYEEYKVSAGCLCKISQQLTELSHRRVRADGNIYNRRWTGGWFYPWINFKAYLIYAMVYQSRATPSCPLHLHVD